MLQQTLRLKNTLLSAALPLAAAVFLLILWAVVQIVRQPDIGALWTDQGVVYYAREGGQLQVSDQIQTIDDLAVAESFFPYYYWRHGDHVQFEILRGGEPLLLTIHFVEAAPPLILLLRLSISTVAVAFWLCGTAVILFPSVWVEQSVLFSLWSQLMGAALALGNVIGYEWTAFLTIVLTWWVVPLAVHFHLVFPSHQLSQRLHRLIWLAYVPPLFATLRLLEVLGVAQWSQPLRTVYAISFYIWVLAGLVMVLLLLSRSYREATDLEAKQRVGLVSMFGFLSFTPLLSFSIFPKLLLGTPLLPIEIGLLFLVGIPIGYGYAITRYKFMRLERYVNRSTPAVLLAGILGAVYLLTTTILVRLLPDNALEAPVAGFVAVLLLLFLYQPLYRRLRRLCDALFYGGWYDYPSAVGEISRFLNKTTDKERLAASLSNSIQKTMRVHWAALLLPADGNEKCTIFEVAGSPRFAPKRFTLGEIPSIVGYLEEQRRPVSTLEIANNLDPENMTATERRLFNTPTMHLWVPIQDRRRLGILVLGPKFGGAYFNEVDMEILDVVAQQARMTLQNLGLITELEARVQENEQYQRELLRVREEERKRIARELHDQVIQSLIGFNYQLANVQSSLDLSRLNPQTYAQTEQLRQNVGELVQMTRDLCQDLRPPALDLGLLHSIRSAVGRFQMQTGIQVELTVLGERNTPVNEDVALCLFRCTCEALSNIHKHAEASGAAVVLALEPEEVRLTIADNGRGFNVPARLGRLMNENHFGLVGMRERLELVDGYFHIVSSPVSGTRLVVHVPLPAAGAAKAVAEMNPVIREQRYV